MPKVNFSKQATASAVASVLAGRHIGTVIQIVGLGDQPAYDRADPPVPSVGIVVQCANFQIAKKMRISDSAYSTMYGYLNASLPDPDAYSGDDPLPMTLGRPVAVEITVKKQFANIDSFQRPMDFELVDVPNVSADDLILLEGVESLTGDNAKTIFLKLHRDIRSWLSQRIRSAS